MRFIFCQDPLDHRDVDSLYQPEAEVLRSLGLDYDLFNFEDLVAGSPMRAVRQIPTLDTVEDAIYRGWMLTPQLYQSLYDALLERGFRLINTPEMYRHGHYLPENYSVIVDFTPQSIWLAYDDTFTMNAVHAALSVFGDKPLIIKDYVKSQKHYWHEACYIPNAADHARVEQVVTRFLELQGADLNEGIVFREFVEFQPLAQHSRSAMPLTEEYRVFVVDGQPALVTQYWSEGEYRNTPPALKQFEPVIQKVNSRFFTMDIARRIGGEWMIVELGDGQVAGLPDHIDIGEFYRALLARLKD